MLLDSDENGVVKQVFMNIPQTVIEPTKEPVPESNKDNLICVKDEPIKKVRKKFMCGICGKRFKREARFKIHK